MYANTDNNNSTHKVVPPLHLPATQANDSPTGTRETSSAFNATNLRAYTSPYSPQTGSKVHFSSSALIQISTIKGIDVQQDEGFTRLTAKENNIDALFTQGMATCIGICLLNLDSKIISLSHISSIFNDFDSELEEELKFLGQGCKVILITNPRCADDDTGLSKKEQQGCRLFQIETIKTIKKLLQNKNADISIEEKHTLTGNFLMTLEGILQDISDTSYQKSLRY